MTNLQIESLPWARFVLAVAVVCGLMALMALVLQYIKTRGLTLPGTKAKTRRLQVIESLPLDTRRRLVLIRCDNKEHLLLFGINADILIPTSSLAKTPGGLQTKNKAQ